MPTWVKCTNTKGEPIYANLENAITMAQRGMRKETAICFGGTSEPLEVRETPEDLMSMAAAGRNTRRTD